MRDQTIDVHELRKTREFSDCMKVSCDISRVANEILYKYPNWKYGPMYLANVFSSLKYYYQSMIQLDPWDTFWQESLKKVEIEINKMIFVGDDKNDRSSREKDN